MATLTTREELKRILSQQSGIVGFTSGTFDLLHAGHVDYLEQAKQQCDVLIVGLNSDSSVKSYKSKDRPINSQDQRALVLCALSCVDYVFIFDEQNNKENISELKPNLYIKAGDYTSDQLGSKDLAESYGGTVQIIPLKHDTSTSKIIEKILNNAHSLSQSLSIPPPVKKPAIFLDRDGTINKDIEYLHEPEKLEFLPGVMEGLKSFMEKGYRLVIVTTQAGIGLGYFTKEDFFKVNKAMFVEFNKHDIVIDRIYYCPHNLNEHCSCRKPSTALVDRAVEDLNLDLEHSVFIGDRSTDIQCGKNVGIKTIGVTTGHETEFPDADFVVGSLKEAAEKV